MKRKFSLVNLILAVVTFSPVSYKPITTTTAPKIVASTKIPTYFSASPVVYPAFTTTKAPRIVTTTKLPQYRPKPPTVVKYHSALVPTPKPLTTVDTFLLSTKYLTFLQKNIYI